MQTRTDSREYRQWYSKGWQYSARPSSNLDHVDSQASAKRWTDAQYNAYLDGYLDYAAGRQKFHRLHCDGSDNAH